MSDQSQEKSAWIAGADGFKHRWFVVLMNLNNGHLLRRIVSNFSDLLVLAERPSVVSVDIPIGLPTWASPGGRGCEREARKLLGPRASSVFSALGRGVLGQTTRLDAHRLSREAGGLGVGAQAWGLAKKLRDADAVMSKETQRTIYEVHPEVCFWAMNDRRPMLFGKKSAQGQLDRQETLIGAGFPEQFIAAGAIDLRVPTDDFLDACAALWTAKRISAQGACRLPSNPDLDPRGLDQAIWY